LVTSGPAVLCPCHGSTYGADGAVLKGPSLQSLSALALTIVGPDVIVDLSRAALPSDRVSG
jgi:Rieske Fe-S protein